MLKLIGHPRSRAIRVLWLLEELGIDYAYDPAPPWSPETLAANPEGKIPALETPDGVLTESYAIMTYLADRHGGPDGPSFPAGGYARAVQDAHALFLLDVLEGALWSWAKHLRRRKGAEPSPDVEAEARADFARGVEDLARRIGDGPFLMGARFTLPDILAGQLGGWAKAVGFPIENDAVAAYLKRVYARPSNARARAVAAAQRAPDF